MVFFISNHFCVVLLLACNFQCVLLVDSNCINVLVCLCMTFLFFVPHLLMMVMWFLSQKNIIGCQFDGFFESLKLLSSCILLVSDSETAFLHFENRFRKICFCLVINFFLKVCRVILMYPIVCLCRVITRSHLSSLIIQLCNIIVCLLLKLSLDIRVRMMDARFGLVISNVLNC